MQKIKYLVTLLLLLITTLSCSKVVKATQPSETDTTRILFIGNSYSYFNSVSELVKRMAEDKFPTEKIETKMISQEGMTLKQLWLKGEALDEIKKEKWDYVVLQEQSTLGTGVIIDSKRHLYKPDIFFEYARKFDSEIKKSGAKTVFYMTWSKKDNPEQQIYLTYAYMTIAKELNSLIAPVGLVWDKNRNNSAFDLYYRDGAHPSVYGSYLAATTLFSIIFSTNPVGVSAKIEGYKLASTGQRSKEMQLLTDIAKDDATTIQRSTWDVINSLRKTDGYYSTLTVR